MEPPLLSTACGILRLGNMAISQRGKLRLREIKGLTHVHPAKKWKSRCPDSDLCVHPNTQVRLAGSPQVGLRVVTDRSPPGLTLLLDLGTSFPPLQEGWSELCKYRLGVGNPNPTKGPVCLQSAQLGWISPAS